MATPKKPVGKTYTLKIPRPQYDRISDAFNLRETYFQHFAFAFGIGFKLIVWGLLP